MWLISLRFIFGTGGVVTWKDESDLHFVYYQVVYHLHTKSIWMRRIAILAK